MSVDRERDTHVEIHLARLAAEFTRWCQEHQQALAAEERLDALGCSEAAAQAAGAAAHAVLQQEDVLMRVDAIEPATLQEFGPVAGILVAAADQGWPLGDLDSIAGRVCRGFLCRSRQQASCFVQVSELPYPRERGPR